MTQAVLTEQYRGRTLEALLAKPRAGRRLQKIGLVALDIVAILAATVIAVLGRDQLTIFRPTQDVTENVLPVAALIVVVWLTMLGLAGAHQLRRVGVGSGEFNAVLSGSVLTAGALGVTFYLANYNLSRGFFLLLFGVGIPLLLLERFVLRRTVHRLRADGRLSVPVVLVGDPAHVDELAKVLRRTPWLGYEVAGVLTPTANPSRPRRGCLCSGTSRRCCPPWS